MAHFDVTVTGGSIRNRTTYECLLTGRPCGLVLVTFRKMSLVPPVWIGRKVSLELPLSEAPSLALWQYFRMVRWMVALLAGGLITKAVFPVLGTENLAVYFALLAVILVSVWFVLGRVLDRFEPVRLASCNQKAGTITLRFTNSDAARRAGEVFASWTQNESRS